MTSPQDAQSATPTALPVPEEAVRAPLPAPIAAAGPSPAIQGAQPEPVHSAPGDIDKRLAFAEQTHQYIREYIRLADQKATFFFSASTALLAFLYKSQASARWLKPVLTWNILDFAAFLAMVSLALAAVVSLGVIVPRTPGSRRGYLFWEAIAEYDVSRQYADDLAGLSIPSLLQVKSEHCHELARVCRRKYSALRASLRIGMVGLGSAIVLFLFG